MSDAHSPRSTLATSFDRRNSSMYHHLKAGYFSVSSSPKIYIFSILLIRQLSCLLLFPYLDVSYLVKHQNVHCNTRKTGESPIDVAGITRFSVIFINTEIHRILIHTRELTVHNNPMDFNAVESHLTNEQRTDIISLM
jgi:hypothetical protein